jgi:hypothetical protein
MSKRVWVLLFQCSERDEVGREIACRLETPERVAPKTEGWSLELFHKTARAVSEIVIMVAGVFPATIIFG